MHLHQIPPWMPAAFEPKLKQEKLRKSKEAERQQQAFALPPDRVPPPKDDDEENDDPHHEHTDIVV
jgi:hypothetical protein